MRQQLLGPSQWLFMTFMFAPLSSCIYANASVPLSYRSPTFADVPTAAASAIETSGHACARAVLGLVAWGDGGYAAAVADAKRKAGVQQLADVRADTDVVNVLGGIYYHQCTRVTARAVR